MGKPILMGRKTFESIGKPLPGRTNIVITRDPDWRAENVKIAYSVEDACNIAEAISEIDGQTELMIIGGAQIYQEALDIADRLYLTEVHAEVAGDALFPDFDRDQWNEVAREDFKAEGPNPYDYSFCVLDRVSKH